MHEAEDLEQNSLDNVATLEKPKPAGFKKKFTVGGYDYVVTHPDPETAYAMGIELTQMIGESIATMTSGAGEKDQASKALQEAAKIFLMKAQPAVMLSLLRRVLKYVELQKNELNGTRTLLIDSALKLHFQGRHGDMLEVFVQSLVFQQADFFLGMKRTLMDMMKKMRE